MTDREPREPADLHDAALRDRAVAAARGDAPFDVLIADGEVLDTVTGERRAVDVGLVGPLIASVHPRGTRHDAAARVDARRRVVCPGLIDSHMHVESSMVTPATYAEAVLARGVTTIVWDPHEFGNVHGLDGVEWALRACEALSLRVILLAPSCVPSAPGLERSGATFDGEDIGRLLARPGIGGVAEVMNMRGTIERREPMRGVVQAGLRSGKPVLGHARGLAGADLAAFMAAGIASDHELVSGEDLLAKLRAGLWIELRGSHDHLLPELADALLALGHLPSTLTLCTDDVFPDDLARAGGLDDVLRRLRRRGLPADWCVRAATLNAALRHARHDLGVVAAGRRADLVVFDDLETFRAGEVFASGRRVAEHGRTVIGQRAIDTAPLERSVHGGPLVADDFRVPASGRRVKLATIDRPRFTRHAERAADVRDGTVVKPADATLIAVLHRHAVTDASPARPTVGYLTGWGDWRGAFCTSVSHDSHNLTAFGGTERDLAAAMNAVIGLQGGLAVAVDGRVVASLALPLSGLVSAAPLAEVADGFAAVRDALDAVIDWAPPYLVFKACFGATLACNDGPHQTDLGLADVARGAPLPSPVLAVLEP